ncbi:MAG: hypothetical protein U9O89_04625 [Thermoproteota archaeon]|nr:hypothetical protein [Thermoproteota archaeon]
MKIRAILGGAFSIVELLSSLFLLWLTLGWRVRKARKAFEKQLIKEGMSKRDAKRLSKQYASLKDKVMSSLWSAVTKNKMKISTFWSEH